MKEPMTAAKPSRRPKWVEFMEGGTAKDRGNNKKQIDVFRKRRRQDSAPGQNHGRGVGADEREAKETW